MARMLIPQSKRSFVFPVSTKIALPFEPEASGKNRNIGNSFTPEGDLKATERISDFFQFYHPKIATYSKRVGAILG